MNGRAENGQFLKGNTLCGKERAIRNGRKPSLKTEVADILAKVEDGLPEILEAMRLRALDPDHKDAQRAAEYLCDRIYGKANQPLSSKDGSPLMIGVMIGASAPGLPFKEMV